MKYVSRAGLKLASVAETLELDFSGKVVLDVGSSTGGFTDYALQHGAKKVIAVDIGTNQLHASLRDNPRIELHEKTDIRDFNPQEKPDLVVIDVSFISLRDILPHIARISGASTKVIAMIKPQFEVGKGEVGKGGIVRDEGKHLEVIEKVNSFADELGLVNYGLIDSPILGADGNKEFLALYGRKEKD